MKILYVEDDINKRTSVIEYIKTIYPNAFIDTGMSVESGVQLGVDNKYDIIILDMTVPNFDNNDGRNGGQSFKNGGEIIVRELLDEGVDFRCVVLTQYETFNNESIDQISDRIKQRCGNKYLGYIKYNKLDEEWKDNLTKILNHVKNNNN